jgi:branched-subunit amino acid transport protein
MSVDLLLMALVVGLATFGFRFGPTQVDLSALPQEGWLARFLASTGPAAIATLFVASILPMIEGFGGVNLPLSLGVAAVLVAFAYARSVVAATLAGSVAYGGAVWILGVLPPT